MRTINTIQAELLKCKEAALRCSIALEELSCYEFATYGMSVRLESDLINLNKQCAALEDELRNAQSTRTR